MTKKNELRIREQVPEMDTWDLKKIFKSHSAWKKSFKELEQTFEGYAALKKDMTKSPAHLLALLTFDSEIERKLEKLGSYAFLCQSVDLANSNSQEHACSLKKLTF